MNALIPAAWAQGAAVPGSPNPLVTMLPMLLIVVVFYFLMIRPQQKKAREHQALLARLAVGDEVVTAGGLLGRVTEVGDPFITLEIADGVRIKVQRVHIAGLMPKGTLKNA